MSSLQDTDRCIKELAMRKVGKAWVDKNNNTWEEIYFTKEEAIKASKTLKDCYNCVNCKNCVSCRSCATCKDCVSCFNCSDCYNCSSCLYSAHCGHCKGCNYCGSCYSCINCEACTECNYCKQCSNCHKLVKFECNPRIYITPCIGRHGRMTTFYWDGDNTWVVTGCFAGSLEQFKRRVVKTHSKIGVHAMDYNREISIMEKLMKGARY
jgi:hypothetical protein